MLEACVKVRFEPKLNNDWIMVTINVRVNSVEPLEKLTYEDWKCLREWHA